MVKLRPAKAFKKNFTLSLSSNVVISKKTYHFQSVSKIWDHCVLGTKMEFLDID